MAWHGFQKNPQLYGLIVGFVALFLVVFWIFKIRNIQRIRGDIVQLEAKLSKGQEIWRNFPPLAPREREELQRAQARLFRMLPKEKDIPSVLQEVSRVAREYELANLSLSTGDGAASPPAGQLPVPAGGAPQVVVPQPAAAVSPGVPESSGAIDSFPIKVTFAGDYRDIAYFLEALQKTPRLMTLQSLRLQRALPLVTAEVVLYGYYQKGNLPVQAR